MAKRGIRCIDFDSGYKRRIDSQIRMNILDGARTQAINVAEQAGKEYGADGVEISALDEYGSDLIEVSSHVGARPRCAPYQGRLFSRSGKSGYTTDLNDAKVFYSSWASTSYGEAAGLLGINCGHQIYPFFPGLSRQTYHPYAEPENNQKYNESQGQRYHERQVKKSKRECAMLDAMGDKEGFQKASALLKQREAALKNYCAGTGRAYKSDRVQVSGFGRSVAVTQPKKVKFTPAKTIEEAASRAKKLGVKYPVFANTDIDTVNEILQAIEITGKTPSTIISTNKAFADITGTQVGRKNTSWYGMNVSNITDLNLKKYGGTYSFIDDDIVTFNFQTYKHLDDITAAKVKIQKAYKEKTGHDWFFNLDGKATIYHELGHYDARVPKEFNALAKKWHLESKIDTLKDVDEAWAEAFAGYYTENPNLPSYIRDFMDGNVQKKLQITRTRTPTVLNSVRKSTKVASTSTKVLKTKSTHVTINACEGLQKQLPYIMNGEKCFIPTNVAFSSVPKAIAGKGSDTAIRQIDNLVKMHGGAKEDWSKMVAKIESDKYIFDIHWYERNNTQYETKLKSRKEK